MNSFRLARYEAGLSVADVASKVGVSEKMIGQYERGEATPRAATAKALADVYEVSVRQLLGIEPPNGDDMPTKAVA
jgi:transcriptional regulator with XRE-family HTH domain